VDKKEINQTKKCPYCGNENDHLIAKCSCGYYFDEEMHKEKERKESEKVEKKYVFGKLKRINWWIGIFIGAAIIKFANIFSSKILTWILATLVATIIIVIPEIIQIRKNR
jgi:hypothetical protein